MPPVVTKPPGGFDCAQALQAGDGARIM